MGGGLDLVILADVRRIFSGVGGGKDWDKDVDKECGGPEPVSLEAPATKVGG